MEEKRTVTPRLGADFALDESSGKYRFARIYFGDNSRVALRNPLTEPGNQVHVNEYLLAINGKPLTAPETPDSMLEGLEGQLDLLIAAGPNDQGRLVKVSPIDDEFDLREDCMIVQNRAKVDKLSGGRVGYLYVADFHQKGTEQFVRQFYPQIGKQALIIDIRANAGGFTSQQILERLRRQVLGLYVNRGGSLATLPAQLISGPKVTLIDQFTGSDGDQFAYYFRQYGLGKVIGTRSWGGVRGISDPLGLADGGRIYVPKDVLFDPKSQWIIENYGTDPDIEVAPIPGESLRGQDIQLDTAIALLVKALDQHPPVVPKAPPAFPSYPAKGQVPAPSF